MYYCAICKEGHGLLYSLRHSLAEWLIIKGLHVLPEGPHKRNAYIALYSYFLQEKAAHEIERSRRLHREQSAA